MDLDSIDMRERTRLSRVLLVDDNASLLLTLTGILEEEGFSVTGCETASECLQHIQQQEFGIAVVDLRLPDMQGTRLLKEIRNLGSKVRVIINTAYCEFESAKDAVNCGAFGYIEKAGEPSNLVREVHRANRSHFESYASELEAAVAERTLELSESEANLRLVFEASPVSLWHEDFSAVKMRIDGLRQEGVEDFREYFENNANAVTECAGLVKILDVNLAALKLLGARSKNELIESWARTFTKESYCAFRDELITLADGKTSFETDTVAPTLSGEKRDVMLRLFVDPDSPNWSSVYVAITDITQRKQAEEALCSSEALLAKAQEIAHIGSFEWDLERDQIDASDECFQIYGISRNDFGGSIGDVMHLIHPDDRGRIQEGIERALTEGTEASGEYRIVRTDGSCRTVFAQGVLLQEAGETRRRMVGFVQDITERKQTEETLNALLMVTSEVTGDEFFARVTKLLTHSLGMSYAHIGEIVEEDHPNVLKIMCYQGNQPPDTPSYDLPGTPCETVVGKTFQIHRGKLWEQFPTFEFLRTRRIQFYVGAPIFSQAGNPIGVLCGMSEKEHPDAVDFQTLITLLAARCGAEIERRKAVETLHNQQAALAHAGRVASVGELSSGIIHEISQPLYAVSNFTGACRRTLEGVEFEGMGEVADCLDRITQATKTAQEIVIRLRDYLKRQDVRQSAVVLNEVIEEVLKLLAFEIRHHRVKVECDLAAETTILGNSVQLQQVLINLIINACEALDGVPEEARRILIRASKLDNEVEITVEDNGSGISEELANHLFEPFVTTKEQGLGIGMAVTKNIISQHDGKIWFTSPPHTGTVFHFTLPVFSGPIDHE